MEGDKKKYRFFMKLRQSLNKQTLFGIGGAASSKPETTYSPGMSPDPKIEYDHT